MNSRSTLKPWDERIGPDASITKLRKGKLLSTRTGEKLVSQIPLPPPGSQFLVDMPKERSRDFTSPVNTDLTIWRAYRSVINGDDSRVEGKRMVNSHIQPVAKIQDQLRVGLRDRLRMQEIKELQMREEHERERQRVLERQQTRGKMQDESLREKAKIKGFDGLNKPVLKQPDRPHAAAAIQRTSLPKLSSSNEAPDATTTTPSNLDPKMLYRTGGKRMCFDHASSGDHGPLFGGSNGSFEDPSHARWTNKTFT